VFKEIDFEPISAIASIQIVARLNENDSMSWVTDNWIPLTVVGGLVGVSWYAGKHFDESESYASWNEHTCEYCGSTDIDYGNNWKCHDCGRYAAETFNADEGIQVAEGYNEWWGELDNIRSQYRPDNFFNRRLGNPKWEDGILQQMFKDGWTPKQALSSWKRYNGAVGHFKRPPLIQASTKICKNCGGQGHNSRSCTNERVRDIKYANDKSTRLKLSRKINALFKLGEGEENTMRYINYGLGALAAGREWDSPKMDFPIQFEYHENPYVDNSGEWKLVEKHWRDIQDMRDDLGVDDFKEMIDTTKWEIGQPNWNTYMAESYDAETFAAYVSKGDTQRVRQLLKQEFPNLKFSVVKDGGRMSVSIMAGDIDFSDINDDVPRTKRYWERWGNPKPVFDGKLDINQYHLDGYNPKYTPLFEKIVSIMKGEDWFDHSDSQTDYFHTAYYIGLNIGKWNKPYEYKPAIKKGTRPTLESLVYKQGYGDDALTGLKGAYDAETFEAEKSYQEKIPPFTDKDIWNQGFYSQKVYPLGNEYEPQKLLTPIENGIPLRESGSIFNFPKVNYDSVKGIQITWGKLLKIGKLEVIDNLIHLGGSRYVWKTMKTVFKKLPKNTVMQIKAFENVPCVITFTYEGQEWYYTQAPYLEYWERDEIREKYTAETFEAEGYEPNKPYYATAHSDRPTSVMHPIKCGHYKMVMDGTGVWMSPTFYDTIEEMVEGQLHDLADAILENTDEQTIQEYNNLKTIGEARKWLSKTTGTKLNFAPCFKKEYDYDSKALNALPITPIPYDSYDAETFEAEDNTFNWGNTGLEEHFGFVQFIPKRVRQMPTHVIYRANPTDFETGMQKKTMCGIYLKGKNTDFNVGWPDYLPLHPEHKSGGCKKCYEIMNNMLHKKSAETFEASGVARKKGKTPVEKVLIHEELMNQAARNEMITKLTYDLAMRKGVHRQPMRTIKEAEYDSKLKKEFGDD